MQRNSNLGHMQRSAACIVLHAACCASCGNHTQQPRHISIKNKQVNEQLKVPNFSIPCHYYGLNLVFQYSKEEES